MLLSAPSLVVLALILGTAINAIVVIKAYPQDFRQRGLSEPVAGEVVPRLSAVSDRPAACPRRYCGCALSLRLFGKIRPHLNLAANWISTFRKTAPAPGMIAARSGHVMLLLQHAGGDKWIVHDPNSGGGLTREHVRSIRYFTVVNPYEPRTRMAWGI